MARGTFTDGFAGYSSCSWPSMRYDYEMSSNSSASSVCREKPTRSHLIRIITSLTGFHLALVVFAAIQIHETRAALVRPNPTSWIVSSPSGLRVIYADRPQQASGPGSLYNKVLPYLIVAPVIIAASWLSLLFWIRELYFEFGYVGQLDPSCFDS